MFWYRSRSVEETPMLLNGSFQDFKDAWYSIWIDKKKDMTHFLYLATPFLEQWEQNLAGTETPSFHFQTLLMRIEAEGLNPLDTIDSWKTNTLILSSLKEELILLLFKIGRKNKWFPKKARPIKVAFIFSILFKGYLQKQITNQSNRSIDLDILVSTHIACEEPADSLHLKNLKLTMWDEYFLELFTEQSCREYLMSRTHLPQHLIRQERIILWNKLNMK